MNNTLSKVLIFVAGAAVGSVVTWKLVETKYKKLAQEEIDSVKAVFAEKYAEPKTEPQEICDDDEPLVVERNNIIDRERYTTYSSISEKESEQVVANVIEEEDVDVPYVISPEEFGELDGYEEISLTYYADGTLTDELDNPVNIYGTVGQAALGRFGEYEDDAIHVRNDARKVDYEVLYDMRRYSDVVNYGHLSTED